MFKIKLYCVYLEKRNIIEIKQGIYNYVVIVQLLSHVQLFVSLSFTTYQSLLKLMSIE